MDVTVNGRRMEVSDELRRLAVDKVGRLARIVDMDRAEVLFSHEVNARIPNQVRCELTLEGHGHHVRSKVADADGFSAIDKALTKVEAQLKRLKSKLRRKGNESLRTAPAEEGLFTAASVAVAEPEAGPCRVLPRDVGHHGALEHLLGDDERFGEAPPLHVGEVELPEQHRARRAIEGAPMGKPALRVLGARERGAREARLAEHQLRARRLRRGGRAHAGHRQQVLG